MASESLAGEETFQYKKEPNFIILLVTLLHVCVPFSSYAALESNATAFNFLMSHVCILKLTCIFILVTRYNFTTTQYNLWVRKEVEKGGKREN